MQICVVFTSLNRRVTPAEFREALRLAKEAGLTGLQGKSVDLRYSAHLFAYRLLPPVLLGVNLAFCIVLIQDFYSL